jgi:hypothetical protein
MFQFWINATRMWLDMFEEATRWPVNQTAPLGYYPLAP